MSLDTALDRLTATAMGIKAERDALKDALRRVAMANTSGLQPDTVATLKQIAGAALRAGEVAK